MSKDNKKNEKKVDSKDEKSKGRKSDFKFSPPSAQSFVFWLIVLFAIPLGLFVFRNQDDSVLLKSSDFEDALTEDRIRTVVIKHDPTSGSRQIEGEFHTANSTTLKKYKVEVTYTDALDDLIREHCKDRKTESVSNFFSNLMLSIYLFLHSSSSSIFSSRVKLKLPERVHYNSAKAEQS